MPELLRWFCAGVLVGAVVCGFGYEWLIRRYLRRRFGESGCDDPTDDRRADETAHHGRPGERLR